MINTQITQLTNDNKSFLQTSQGAATLYNQSLTNLANLINNPNLNDTQRTTALNDQVKQLSDGLAVLQVMAGLPQVTSGLTFSSDGTGIPTAAPAGGTTPPTTPAATTPPATAPTGLINSPPPQPPGVEYPIQQTGA